MLSSGCFPEKQYYILQHYSHTIFYNKVPTTETGNNSRHFQGFFRKNTFVKVLMYTETFWKIFYDCTCQGEKNKINLKKTYLKAYKMFGVIRNFEDTKLHVLADSVTFHGKFKVSSYFKLPGILPALKKM